MSRRMELGLDLSLLVLALVAVSVAVLSFSHRRQEGPVASPGEWLGDHLPSFGAALADGSTDTISLASERPSLVMLFLSTCAGCDVVASQWSTTLARARGQVRSVAVNLENVTVARRWLSDHGIQPEETVVPTDVPGFIRSWRLRSVPLTLVLSGSGEVAFARTGRLDDDALEHAICSLVAASPSGERCFSTSPTS